MDKPKPVLIVEDHRIMRDSLQEFLTEVAGVEVCGVAETGEEAFRLCKELHPEIAIIDVSLPGMSGLELAEKLRAHDPSITVMMLSGHQEITYVRRALAVGARGYILKGDPNDIVTAIEEIARGHTYFTAELRPAVESFGSENNR